MNNLLRRLRGALGMGVSWAALGFLLGGVPELIGNIWPNPISSAVDIWPAVLAFPAFFGGLGFSVVLAIAGRRKRFDELSLGRFALLGAAGGLLASLFPVLVVAVGAATPNVPVWEITLALAGPLSVGGAVAASATLAVARMSEDQVLLDTSDEVAEVGLTPEEARELLGS